VRAAWWQEQQDEDVNSFLVEPQNQGRVRTTWEPSHEWRLAVATPSLRGLQWFTRKPLCYWVEPQNRGRRLNEKVRPLRLVQPPRRGGQTAWASLTAQGGGGGLTAWVAATEKLRSGGHASGSQGLRRAKQGCGRWASVWWRKSEDFQIRP
jgi:hypothetical protein